jgi:hypothetical protein
VESLLDIPVDQCIIEYGDPMKLALRANIATPAARKWKYSFLNTWLPYRQEFNVTFPIDAGKVEVLRFLSSHHKLPQVNFVVWPIFEQRPNPVLPAYNPKAFQLAVKGLRIDGVSQDDKKLTAKEALGGTLVNILTGTNEELKAAIEQIKQGTHPLAKETI